MHQLLDYILHQTGPADVILTAFSLTEAAVRCLFSLKEDGFILQLHCLFNNQMPRFKTDLMLFAGNIASGIRLAPCHAKVIILRNTDYQVMIISSANMTTNARYEASVLCTDPEAVESMYQKVYNSYLEAMPLTYDESE